MEMTMEQALQRAVEAHKAGKLQDAEALYRAILQIQPQHPDANHNLGVLAVSLNKSKLALPLFKTALEANPKQGQFWMSYVDGLIKEKLFENARSVLEQGRRQGLSGNKVDALEASLVQFLANLESKEPEPNKIDKAIELRETGRYQEAQDWLIHFLSAEPADAEAWSLLSQIFLHFNKYAEAENAISNAISSNPELPSTYRNHAKLLLKKSKPEAALIKAQCAYDRSIEDPESWLVLAACLGANQRDAEALALIDRTLQASPNYAEALVTRAMIRLRAKDSRGAMEDLELAISLKPHLSQLWGLLGTLRYQSNNVTGAIEALKKAHRFDPGNANYMIDLGEFLRQDNRIAEAITILEEATVLAPDNANGWINLGATFQQGGKIDNAKLAYEKALAIMPKSSEISSNLGAIAKEAGDLVSARKYFEQALEAKPDLAEAHNNLGAVLQELGRLKEAETCFRKAIGYKPEYAEAYNNLGNILKELGSLAEAEASYKKAIAIKSEYAEAHNNLGNTLRELGKLEETEALYKKAIALKPNFDQAQYNLGILYCEQGKYKLAAEQLSKLKSFRDSQSYLLKCWYFLDEQILLYSQLDSLIRQDETNPIIGSFICRGEIKYGVAKSNPFCNTPFKYILKTNLSKKYDFQDLFVKPTMSILNDVKIQKRTQTLLANGIQTAGNIFALENKMVDEIKRIIGLEIEKYRSQLNDSNEGFINKWPDAYSLNGWIISMKSGGNLNPHMHENGWISGSIYINVPPKIKINDGNLVVCIEDDKLLNEPEKNQKNIIDVTTGSLCLFPASLLHYTIPFESDEDRIVLAFDVVPKIV